MNIENLQKKRSSKFHTLMKEPEHEYLQEHTPRHPEAVTAIETDEKRRDHRPRRSTTDRGEHSDRDFHVNVLDKR